ITMLLLRFKIVAGILKLKKQKEIHSQAYRIEAAGLNIDEPLKLNEAKQNLNAARWNDIVFARIKSIKKIRVDPKTKVYDFEVNSSAAPYQNFIGGFGGVCCHNSEHQMLLAEKAGDMVKEKNIKLVIVDSLTAQFRSEFVGRGTLAGRQQKLNQHMRTLQKLAEMHNIAVLVTNQVMERPDILFGDPTAPIGGNVVAHACLDGNSFIQLNDGGIQQMQHLNQNNAMAADLNGNFLVEGARISLKSARPDIKEVFEIDTGYKIVASGEHRFFKLDGFKIKEIKAVEIKKCDYLLHAKTIECAGAKQALPKQELKEMVIVNQAGADLIKNSMQQMDISRKEACNLIEITPRQLRRVLNQGYPTAKTNMLLLVKEGFDKKLLENIDQHTSHKFKELHAPQFFTEETAQITGYLLGDGNLDKRSVRFRDARKDVLESYAGLIKKTFKADTNITKIKNKNCYQISINSKEIKEFFENINKNWTNMVPKSSPAIVKSFIKGFVDAEGSVDKKTRRISIAQKNEQTLRIIQMLLLRFGISSKIRPTGKSKKPFPLLELFSTDVVKYNEIIGLSAKDKSEQLKKWADSFKENLAKEIVPLDRHEMRQFLREVFIHPSKILKQRNYKYITTADLKNIVTALQEKELAGSLNEKKEFLTNLLNGDIKFLKVLRINKLENTQPLYDLSTPGKENYIANGFIVHNSKTRLYLRKSKEDKRVAKLVDSPSLPDGEALYRVTANGIEDIE
ncbi:MAG: hypothetical protein HYW50_03720, partial [Candidatus Diapherotrites archaeon]|nr:hypothetical protein [Candidatus Diapherotrites archaeon]